MIRSLVTIGITLTMLLLWNGSAVAQTDPCDLTVPPSAQVRRADAVRIAFCHELRDDGNDPIPLGQVHFYLLEATTNNLIADLGLLQPVSGPNAAGAYYYEQTQPRTYAADISVTVTAEYNQIQSLPSTPFLIDVRGGPKAPTGLRIVLQ